MISQRLGLLPPEIVERQRALLGRFGLPAACSNVDVDSVVRAMELDKKVRGKNVRWVLLAGIGRPVVRDDVPREMVLNAVQELMQS